MEKIYRREYDMIIGNKVKKYLVVTCPNCGESYKLDWKIVSERFIKNNEEEIVCPWCEHSVYHIPEYSMFKVVDTD